jgi:hypothetical protein
MFDPKMISQAIRAKKKKMMDASPELVDTDARVDMNPMDYYNVKQQARMESTMGIPKKINADETMIDEDNDNIGVSPEEKSRMGRLRKYITGLDL